MSRVSRIDRAGHWPREKSRGTVTLDYEDRHRRRLQLTSDAGLSFLLDLARATVLADGDGLPLEDGGWIEVKAAPEMLIEVTAPSPEALCRLAWHIGNRHVAASIEQDRILLRDDHVLVAMLEGLGATVHPVSAPFTPERGAYAPAAAHHHDHDHDHHGHAHDHEHHRR
jgi:urease accessory protein